MFRYDNDHVRARRADREDDRNRALRAATIAVRAAAQSGADLVPAVTSAAGVRVPRQRTQDPPAGLTVPHQRRTPPEE